MTDNRGPDTMNTVTIEREALEHCKEMLMRHEINHVDGAKIADDALSKIRAALAAEPVEPTYTEMLEAGIDAADTLKAIGRRIGFGRAQQILGETWDAEHGCAPRGSMGVTVNDTAQPAPAALPLTDEQIRALFLAHGFTIKDGLTDLKPYVYAAARSIERAHGIGGTP